MSIYGGLLGIGLGLDTRRRVFVSYHHKDRWAYDLLSNMISYNFLTDHSLEEEIDSDDDEYVFRTIREGNITGSTCTIVLCGAETWTRKHVDWELNNHQLKLVGLCCGLKVRIRVA